MIRPALLLTADEVRYLFDQLEFAEMYERDQNLEPDPSWHVPVIARPLRQKIETALREGCNVILPPEAAPPLPPPEPLKKKRGRPPKVKP